MSAPGRPTLDYARPDVRGPRFRLARTLLVAGFICGVVLVVYFAMMPADVQPKRPYFPAPPPDAPVRPPPDMFEHMRPRAPDRGGPRWD